VPFTRMEEFVFCRIRGFMWAHRFSPSTYRCINIP